MYQGKSSMVILHISFRSVWGGPACHVQLALNFDFPFVLQINTREEPYAFDRGIVSQQIRVLQIFETLQLLQSGE